MKVKMPDGIIQRSASAKEENDALSSSQRENRMTEMTGVELMRFAIKEENEGTIVAAIRANPEIAVAETIKATLLSTLVTLGRFDMALAILGIEGVRACWNEEHRVEIAAFSCKRRGAWKVLEKILSMGFQSEINRTFSGIRETCGVPDGSTCLHVAALRGNLRACEILINNGADINAVSPAPDCFSPLLISVKSSIVGFQHLLKNIYHPQGGRLPQYAAGMRITELLLEHGADCNAIDKFGNTPMMLAVGAGRRQMAMLLSSYGATRELSSDLISAYDNVYEACMETDNVHTYKWLLESREWTSLHHVAVLSPRRAQKLLDDGADPMARATFEDAHGSLTTRTPADIAGEILASPDPRLPVSVKEAAVLIIAAAAKHSSSPSSSPSSSSSSTAAAPGTSAAECRLERAAKRQRRSGRGYEKD